MEDKKVAIMQPYFFPYIGYFQLINAVDVYVNLDHVSFMKRSYMTRNTLKNNVSINVHVNKGTQNISCNKTTVNFEHNYINNTIKTLHNLYSKSTRYEEIMNCIVLPELFERQISISTFNINLIKKICNYLDIRTEIIETSSNINDGLKGSLELINITKKLSGSTYINAPGGQKLYSKEEFSKEGLNLKFISMNELDLQDPYLSILHQLFQYPKEHLKNQIVDYRLI